MAMPEIKTIEDLRGKPVGVTRFGSSTDFTMRYLLRKHGMNPDRRDDDPAGDLSRQRRCSRPRRSSRRHSRARPMCGAGGGRALTDQHGHRRVYFPHDALMARRALSTAMKILSAGRPAPIRKACIDCSPIRAGKRACGNTRAPATPKSSMRSINTPSITLKNPYNSRERFRSIDQSAVRNPKAKDAKPESFYDDKYIASWIIRVYKQLWK